MTIAVGFDIGGTFTDFAMLDASSGQWYFTKVRTTPRDRSLACAEGVQALLHQAGGDAREVTYLAHGSTVVTNVLIERNGARTALLTTNGFRDVLEIRRQVMPHRYDVRVLKPEPFVPRPLRIEIHERVLADGTVETAVDDAEMEEVLERLKAEGIEAVAISFLHAYLNPINEQKARAFAENSAGWYLCASHEVLNEFREYERTSTTVANAYVAPPMQRYLQRLEQRLHAEIGIEGPLLIFQSSGGVVPTAQARKLPIASVVSGPAAGVVAACAVAGQVGMDDFISLDMGGTSCDVSLIKDGSPTLAYAQEIAGWPVHTPRLDIHTVGAGGGSIAWVDAGGLLKVGPQSAGADPGPACYAQGGTQATVTDANVVLGRLNPEYLLAGKMTLQRALAVEAIRTLGARLNLEVDRVAAGILDIVNSTMIRAIRVVSVEKGYDPRDFALLAFGGAGPLHACDLAREMDIRTVIVPPHPGVLSALGLLVSDLRVDGSHTRRFKLSEIDSSLLRETFAGVEDELRRSAAVRSRPDAEWTPSWALDMRYLGQSFELRVPVTTQVLRDESLTALATALDAEHERMYGFATPEEDKEIVCFRVSLRAPAGLESRQIPTFPVESPTAPSTRRVFFKGSGWVEKCPVYQRTTLPVGTRLDGPAIVEQMDTTTVVNPGFRADVDPHLNVILEQVR